MTSAEDKKKEKDKMVSRKSRIQTIAIIFLVFMLILTFFSNTIMNKSLTEVSTQAIYSDVLTNKVRGSGSVEAGQVYYVSIKESRRIQTMNVKAGQEVKTGDVLLVLSETDSEELATAKSELKAAEISYEGNVLSAGLTVAEREAIENGEIGTLSDRQNRLQIAQMAADNALLSMDEIQREVDMYTADDGSSSSELGSIEELEEQLQMKILDHSIEGMTESFESAKTNLDNAQSDYNEKETAYDGAIKAIEDLEYEQGKIEKKIPKAKKEMDDALQKYNAAVRRLEETQETYEYAEMAYNEYVFKYYDIYGDPAQLVGADAYKQLSKWYLEYIRGSVVSDFDFIDEPSEDLKKAYSEVYGLKSAFDFAKKSLAEAEKSESETSSDYSNAKSKYEALVATKEENDEKLLDLQRDLGIATEAILKADEELSKSQTAYDLVYAQYTPLVNQKSELTYESDLRKLQEQIDDLEQAYADDEAAKEKAENLKALQLKLTEAKLYKEKKEAELEDLKSLLATQLSLGTEYKNIKALRKKVKLLKKDTLEKDVTAPVPGIITEVFLSAGQTATPDENIVAIQPDNEDFTIKFDVTAAQARRVKPGDDATILNNWSANDIKARVKAIQPNKTDRTMSTLIIQLSGDVVVGNSYTVSVGTSSTSYDYIVPTSSIREDSTGKFILTIESKSTPLGNRYYARRTDVEVLASDDTKSAISAVLDDNAYVITTTAKPIEAGEQVRLTDE